MIKNKEELYTHIENLEDRLKVLGLPLHEYQALLALRIPEFKEAILEKLQKGFYLINVVRVYYSQVVSVLEVAARFAVGKKEEQKRCAVLVTFKSTDFSLISIAKEYEDLEIDAPMGVTLLPMAMAAPKKNECVGNSADMGLYGVIKDRRTQYINSLFMVNDEEESYLATDCQSCNPSSTMTDETSTFDTSDGPGTGTTHPDQKTDSKLDDNQDCVTDISDDGRFFQDIL
ncbi:hypothetical protein MOF37_21295 [Bacillus spizizenii]|nr:hypothetical protein [Bacillus spizizenii]MCY9425449.1 hypothetical protein [Bacillus spizizenii]MCY9431841.1 hypothetical protein [Bacillus spizizenii]